MQEHSQSNVEADEGDLSIDGWDVLGNGVASGIDEGFVESDSDTDDSDDELADKHTKSAVDEERSSSNALHSPEGEGSRADIDQVEDEGDKESVANGSGGLQERGRVVEDEVDTGPLLHHLEGCSENGLAEIGV